LRRRRDARQQRRRKSDVIAPTWPLRHAAGALDFHGALIGLTAQGAQLGAGIGHHWHAGKRKISDDRTRLILT
jgi:hypothetical protein